MFVKMPSGYHQKNKERLRKEPREMYQNLSEEEKNIKHHNACKKYQNLSEEEEEEKKKKHLYHRERHDNLSEEEKQKIAERRRTYYIIQSNGVKFTHYDFKSKFYAPVFLVPLGLPTKSMFLLSLQFKRVFYS